MNRELTRRRVRLLTPKQRSYLGRLAKTAHAKLTAAGAIDEPENEWRAREATTACGCRISLAPRQAFDAIEQHFLALAGRSKEAFDRAAGPDNEMRGLALAIDVAAKQCGVGPNYLAAICRRQSHDTRETWRNAAEGRALLAALKNHLKAKQADLSA